MTQFLGMESQKKFLGLVEVTILMILIGCMLAQENNTRRAAVTTQVANDCDLGRGGWEPCEIQVAPPGAKTEKKQLNNNTAVDKEDEEEEQDEDLEPSPEDEYEQQSTLCSLFLTTMEGSCQLDNLTQLADMSLEQTDNCCNLLAQAQEIQCEDFCQLTPLNQNFKLWETVCRFNLCQQDPITINTQNKTYLEELTMNASEGQGQGVPIAEQKVPEATQVEGENQGDVEDFVNSIQRTINGQEPETSPEILEPKKDACVIQKHSNADGVTLVETIAEDEGDCCAQCQDVNGCNTFVYCPKIEGCRSVYSNPIQIFDYKMCHLKQQVSINLGANPVYFYRGVETDFVSGFIFGRTTTQVQEDQMESSIDNSSVPIDNKVCASYVTDGPNRVAASEGDQMQAPSGNKFLNVGDAKECVTACKALIKNCGQVCCDSVAYNPQYKQCWLKHGGSSEQTNINENGWQTFWRNDQKNQKYQASINAFEICDDDIKGGEYTDAYVTYGVGQLAVSEGSIIPMADGLYSKKLSLKECAQECQKRLECDAMTYSVRKLTCFLRSGSRKFETISNEEGWTTYWRIPSSSATTMCGTQKGWYCLYCGGTYGDQCDYY